MRIISDFHDYYDVGMQNGIDPQLPYLRFRREESFDWQDGPKLWYPSFFDDYCADKFRVLFIGFAGKVYPVLEHVNDPNHSTYYYDPDQIDSEYFDETVSKWRGFDEVVNKAFACGRKESRIRTGRNYLATINSEIKEMLYHFHEMRLQKNRFVSDIRWVVIRRFEKRR